MSRFEFFDDRDAAVHKSQSTSCKSITSFLVAPIRRLVRQISFKKKRTAEFSFLFAASPRRGGMPCCGSK